MHQPMAQENQTNIFSISNQSGGTFLFKTDKGIPD